MTWGEAASHFERLRERGRELPKRYLQRPSVAPGLEWFWRAFWALNDDRTVIVVPMGMGPAVSRALGIPFAAIDTYARRYRIESDAFDTFLAILKALDATYLSLRNNPDAIDLTSQITPEDGDYVRQLLSPQVFDD